MQKNQIFQKKHWIALITKVFALILGITLTLPTFAATAAPLEIEGTWELVSQAPGPIPFELTLHDGHDYGGMLCNYHFGNYYDVLQGAPCSGLLPIRFAPQSSTKGVCPENKLESEYLEQLQSVGAYEVCQDQLTLYDRYGILQYVKVSD